MATSSQNDSDQTDVYQDLSSHLYLVLDVVGVSEEMREGYREGATLWETLDTVVNHVLRKNNTSSYIFGSRYEGTTTRGLASDTDEMICDETLPVIENIDIPHYFHALLMIYDDTKSGYVKLQSVFNRKKETMYRREVTRREAIDHQGRILVNHNHPLVPGTERHGPAISSGEGDVQGDLVPAFRCRTIPSFADEWLHRPRPYEWPSKDQLQRIGSYGCFLVGVGHPKSGNKETEWRISFSLQERDLMSSLNPTQHKCYVLLKLIKKDIIQSRVGKSLSSYHCKTCIFHLVESRGIEQWTPKNLVSRLLESLWLLLVWVRQENCPNYFIKEENMFDKLDKSTLIRISLVLQELLSSGVQFLYEIKCDDLGMLLTMSKSDRRLEEKKLEMKQYYVYQLYLQMAKKLLFFKVHLFQFIDNATSPSERFSRVNYILQYLEYMSDDVTDATELKPRGVQMVLDRSVPYIRFIIVQMKCSSELVKMGEKTCSTIQTTAQDSQLFIPYIRFGVFQLKCLNELVEIEEEQNDEIIQTLVREILLCDDCGGFPSRLIVASLYLQRDKLERCQETLFNCETSFKSYVISICACHVYPNYRNTSLTKKIVAENLSFEEYHRECTAACMIFLPSEANLVPAALRYEMYRSVYTPPRSRDERADCWFDWIVVDFKVYLYFLQYILYVKTNETANKEDVIDSLLLLTDLDTMLGHKETALNLLGWIYMQENRVNDAIVCFRRSLAIRPLHNAAKWHMAMLLHSLINSQNRS